MDFFKNKSLLFSLLLLSLLFSCNSEEPKKTVVEKSIAISFFNAIYNENDLQKALSLSSFNFKKELEKYHTTKNIARRIFEMSFDTVSIHTSSMKTQIINEHHVQVTMMVEFTGILSGKHLKDYKKIRLIKEGDKWLIDKLLEVD